MYEHLETAMSPFIFCFSEELDDLSQWRYYSDDGKGFMIGFNTEFLPKNSLWEFIFSTNSNTTKLYDFFIDQVIYKEDEQRNLINKLNRYYKIIL